MEVTPEIYFFLHAVLSRVCVFLLAEITNVMILIKYTLLYCLTVCRLQLVVRKHFLKYAVI